MAKAYATLPRFFIAVRHLSQSELTIHNNSLLSFT